MFRADELLLALTRAEVRFVIIGGTPSAYMDTRSLLLSGAVTRSAGLASRNPAARGGRRKPAAQALIAPPRVAHPSLPLEGC
jgi:hypothetical protein